MPFLLHFQPPTIVQQSFMTNLFRFSINSLFLRWCNQRIKFMSDLSEVKIFSGENSKYIAENIAKSIDL